MELPFTDVAPLDPDLPRQRRTIAGGIIFSAAVIAIVLFSLGDLPQVDALFSGLDAALRSRNDVIVKDILHSGPFAVIAAAAFGLTYALIGHIKRQKPSA